MANKVGLSQQEIDAAINTSRMNFNSAVNSRSENENIYSNAFLAAQSGANSAYHSNNNSVFQTYNSFPNQFGGSMFDNSDFIAAYGLHLLQLAASMGTPGSFGTCQPSAPVDTTSAPAATNDAEVFNSLTKENRQKLADLEKQIAAKKEEQTKETDSKKRNALSAEVRKLESQYRSLERQYCKGKSLSTMFGKSFNFYKNLDEDEIEQIKDANEEIESLKSELQSKQEDYEKEWAEVEKEKANFERQNRRQATPEEVQKLMTPEQKEFFEMTKGEIDDLKNRIKNAIYHLKLNIKEAGKDDKTTYFENKTAERTEKANKHAEETAKKEAVKKASGWFGDDGKLKSEEDIRKSITDMDGFVGADKEKVADFIYEQIKDKTKDDEVKEYLGSKAFFEAASKGTFVNGDPVSKENLKLLRAIYDGKMGEGKFKEYVDNYGKSGAKVASLKAALDEIEKEEPTKENAAQATTPSPATPSPATPAPAAPATAAPATAAPAPATKTPAAPATAAPATAAPATAAPAPATPPTPAPAAKPAKTQTTSVTFVGVRDKIDKAEDKDSVLKSLSDEELVVYLSDIANLDYLLGSDISNHAETLGTITDKLNRIAKEKGINERLCYRKGCIKCMEPKGASELKGPEFYDPAYRDAAKSNYIWGYDPCMDSYASAVRELSRKIKNARK